MQETVVSILHGRKPVYKTFVKNAEKISPKCKGWLSLESVFWFYNLKKKKICVQT